MSGTLQDAYVSGRVTALYGAHFAHAEDRRRSVLRAVRPLAPGVADVLERQQAKLPPSPARARTLALLREGAAAVVTGQQVGLFLGPLYTLYKAASAVRVARVLEEETGAPVVPVFWLQTEDHDLVEIATTYVPGRHGVPSALEVPVAEDNRVPVAHCVLPAEVDGCLAELHAALGHLPHAAEHLERLARHYRAGAPWVEAFAAVFAELFAHTGLVLIDPRDPALAPVAASVHRRALADSGRISRALLERVEQLQAEGFAVPIHVRPDAPLSFFQPGPVTGPRYRLAPTPGGFCEVGGSDRVHPLPSLLDALESEPLRFSTSALLRPILQDTLLPTAAYVGGPGEIAYFGQLQPLYAAFELPMPLVVPRARFRVIDERARRLMERLEQRSRASATAGLEPAEALEHALNVGFERVMTEVLAKVPSDLPGVSRAAAKTRGKVARAAALFRRKYEKALTLRDRDLAEDRQRLEALLKPDGVPQERFYGMAYFAARIGERAFVDQVLAEVVPWDPIQRDLQP